MCVSVCVYVCECVCVCVCVCVRCVCVCVSEVYVYLNPHIKSCIMVTCMILNIFGFIRCRIISLKTKHWHMRSNGIVK